MKQNRQNRNNKAGSETTVSALTKRWRRAKKTNVSVAETLEQINLNAAGSWVTGMKDLLMPT